MIRTMAVSSISRAGVDPASGAVDRCTWDVFYRLVQAIPSATGSDFGRNASEYPLYNSKQGMWLELKAAMIASTEIIAGVSKIVVAGGMESMSNSPLVRNAKGIILVLFFT